MPQYTLINKKTEEQWDVTSMKVPDGFTDLKKRIKKGSGAGNTVNV